jgi:hypothetical protein
MDRKSGNLRNYGRSLFFGYGPTDTEKRNRYEIPAGYSTLNAGRTTYDVGGGGLNRGHALLLSNKEVNKYERDGTHNFVIDYSCAGSKDDDRKVGCYAVPIRRAGSPTDASGTYTAIKIDRNDKKLKEKLSESDISFMFYQVGPNRYDKGMTDQIFFERLRLSNEFFIKTIKEVSAIVPEKTIKISYHGVSNFIFAEHLAKPKDSHKACIVDYFNLLTLLIAESKDSIPGNTEIILPSPIGYLYKDLITAEKTEKGKSKIDRAKFVEFCKILTKGIKNELPDLSKDKTIASLIEEAGQLLFQEKGLLNEVLNGKKATPMSSQKPKTPPEPKPTDPAKKPETPKKPEPAEKPKPNDPAKKPETPKKPEPAKKPETESTPPKEVRSNTEAVIGVKDFMISAFENKTGGDISKSDSNKGGDTEPVVGTAKKTPNIKIKELENVENILKQDISSSDTVLDDEDIIYNEEVISAILKIEKEVKYRPFIGIEIALDEDDKSFTIVGFMEGSRAKVWADENNISVGTMFAFNKDIKNFKEYVVEKIRSGTLSVDDLDIEDSEIIRNTQETVRSEKEKETILKDFIDVQPLYYDKDGNNPEATVVKDELLSVVTKVKSEIDKANLEELTNAGREFGSNQRKERNL